MVVTAIILVTFVIAPMIVSTLIPTVASVIVPAVVFAVASMVISAFMLSARSMIGSVVITVIAVFNAAVATIITVIRHIGNTGGCHIVVICDFLAPKLGAPGSPFFIKCLRRKRYDKCSDNPCSNR
jgi:hypothetical protein